MADVSPHAPEQRKVSRRRVNKFANLEIDETSAIPCVVKNLSESGALIMVRDTTYVPDEIVLAIPEDGFRRRAVLKWRRARSIGVMFTSDT